MTRISNVLKENKEKNESGLISDDNVALVCFHDLHPPDNNFSVVLGQFPVFLGFLGLSSG